MTLLRTLSIELYQEYNNGVYEAKHVYVPPYHSSGPLVIEKRIIYISNPGEYFNLFNEQNLLCNFDGIEVDGVHVEHSLVPRRKKVIENDKRQFKRFPKNVKDAIADENTLLYIDHSIEGYRDIRLDDVASIFNIPIERLRFLTSAYSNAGEQHPFGPNIIYRNRWEHHVQGSITHHESTGPEFKKESIIEKNFKRQLEFYDTKRTRGKLCSSYMRRRRLPRILLSMFLNKNKLLKDMYWSLGIFVDGETRTDRALWQISVLERYMKKNYQYELDDNDFDWIKSIKKNISCDEHDMSKKLLYETDYIVWSHAYNTKFSLVNETQPSSIHPIEKKLDYFCPFLSEKTFKPIVAGQMFVIHGCPGSIVALRKRGYDVFDDFIDHGYDTTSDTVWRTIRVAEEIKRLSEIPDAVWEEKLKEFIPRFEHNFNTLMNSRPISHKVTTFLT